MVKFEELEFPIQIGNVAYYNPTPEQRASVELRPWYLAINQEYGVSGLMNKYTACNWMWPTNCYFDGYFCNGFIYPKGSFKIIEQTPATGYCLYVLEKVE